MPRGKPKRAGQTPGHEDLVQRLVGDPWALFLDDPLQDEDVTAAEKRKIIAEAEDILAERKLRKRAATLRARLDEWPEATHEQVRRELEPIEKFLNSRGKHGKTKRNAE